MICAAVEYHGGTKTLALEAIEERITNNTIDVLRRVRDGVSPRDAATRLARERIDSAMKLRRRFLA